MLVDYQKQNKRTVRTKSEHAKDETEVKDSVL